MLLRNLDNLILPENVYLWNTLMSVYQWLVLSNNVQNGTVNKYFPFTLGKNYYAMEYDTFEVYPIIKKEYKQLKKELEIR
jgi:hypothetical protein